MNQTFEPIVQPATRPVLFSSFSLHPDFSEVSPSPAIDRKLKMMAAHDRKRSDGV